MSASVTLHPASAARLSHAGRLGWSHARQSQGLVVRPALGSRTLTAWPKKPRRAVGPTDNPPPAAA